MLMSHLILKHISSNIVSWHLRQAYILYTVRQSQCVNPNSPRHPFTDSQFLLWVTCDWQIPPGASSRCPLAQLLWLLGGGGGGQQGSHQEQPSTLARDEDRVGRGSQRLQRHTSTHSCLIRQKTQKSPGSRSGGVLRSTTQPEWKSQKPSHLHDFSFLSLCLLLGGDTQPFAEYYLFIPPFWRNTKQWSHSH